MNKIDCHKIELRLTEAYDRLGDFSDTEDWGNLTESGRRMLGQTRMQIKKVLSEIYLSKSHALLPESFVDAELK